VDITMGPDADLPLTMMQVCDPERLTTYIPGRDPYRRWEFELVDGDVREEMCQAENIEKMLEPWLPPEQYEIRRAAVYQFHAATAADWRSGRILLAGDAAHQTPPFLGQGVNSGFRDAVCLGWKIPLVLSGESDAALLDSYQAERGAHSRDLVDRAVGIGQLMETLAAREAGQPDPHADAEARAAAPDGQLIPPIRGGTLIDDQITDGSPVGRAFFQPHVRETGTEGPTKRLDTALGKGFAIVGRSADDLRMGAKAQSVFERLGAQTATLDQFEVVEGEFDPLFATHPAVVVRPDRLIFGVVDSDYDLDRLLGELNRKLSLNLVVREKGD
jgi:3-(3-hydroxy-phenyl)propionate hydroxylase